MEVFEKGHFEMTKSHFRVPRHNIKHAMKNRKKLDLLQDQSIVLNKRPLYVASGFNTNPKIKSLWGFSIAPDFN